MSSGKSSAPKPVQAAEPAPKNEVTYINGREVSSRLYNPSTQTFTNSTNLSDIQADTLAKGEQAFAGLLDQVPGIVNPSEESRAQYQKSLYDPQAQKLQDSYNQTLGQAINAANAQGVSGSVGFERFRANQLDKNLNQGKAELENQTYLQSLQLPMIKLAPVLQALGIYDTSINSGNNQLMSQLNPSLQGSLASQGFAQQQAALRTQTDLANRQFQATQRPGLFASMF